MKGIITSINWTSLQIKTTKLSEPDEEPARYEVEIPELGYKFKMFGDVTDHPRIKMHLAEQLKKVK